MSVHPTFTCPVVALWSTVKTEERKLVRVIAKDLPTYLKELCLKQ